MMITSEKLLEAIGELREEFIRDAKAPVPESGLSGGAKRSSGRKAVRVRRILIVAAILAALAALCFTVYATRFFGLRRFLSNGNKSDVDVMPDGTVHSDTPVTDSSDILSLQGTEESAESQAALEWTKFLENYDSDGTILDAVGNSVTVFAKDYPFYSVYTWEMADKLEEILAKYNLKKHTRMEVLSHEDLVKAVGGEFLIGNYPKGYGYIYEDGYFSTDDDVVLKSGVTVDCQIVRSVKGTLTTAMLELDASEYEDLPNRNPDVPLVLSLSPWRAILTADLGDAVVTVMVLEPITESDLYELADAFDWEVLGNVITPDLDAIVGPVEDDWDNWDGENAMTYESVLRHLHMWHENSVYTLRDLDGDGSEELLVRVGDRERYYAWHVYTQEGILASYAGQFNGYHSTLYGREAGGLWLYQDYVGAEGLWAITLEGGRLSQETIYSFRLLEEGESATQPSDIKLEAVSTGDASLLAEPPAFRAARDNPLPAYVEADGEKTPFSGIQIQNEEEKQVAGTFTVLRTLSGEDAALYLGDSMSYLQLAEDEEYVVYTLRVSYDEGDADELWLYMETEWYLDEYDMYFYLQDGHEENSWPDMIPRQDVPLGGSVIGDVAFIRKKGVEYPLWFVGLGGRIEIKTGQ